MCVYLPLSLSIYIYIYIYLYIYILATADTSAVQEIKGLTSETLRVLPVSVNKTQNLLRKLVPCNPVAEIAIEPLIW